MNYDETFFRASSLFTCLLIGVVFLSKVTASEILNAVRWSLLSQDEKLIGSIQSGGSKLPLIWEVSQQKSQLIVTFGEKKSAIGVNVNLEQKFQR